MTVNSCMLGNEHWCSSQNSPVVVGSVTADQVPIRRRWRPATLRLGGRRRCICFTHLVWLQLDFFPELCSSGTRLQNIYTGVFFMWWTVNICENTSTISEEKAFFWPILSGKSGCRSSHSMFLITSHNMHFWGILQDLMLGSPLLSLQWSGDSRLVCRWRCLFESFRKFWFVSFDNFFHLKQTKLKKKENDHKQNIPSNSKGTNWLLKRSVCGLNPFFFMQIFFQINLGKWGHFRASESVACCHDAGSLPLPVLGFMICRI